MILRHLFAHFALLIGLVKLYNYMKNFCNLIGLKQWYFSVLILNTYMWKLQTFCGFLVWLCINKYWHDSYVILGIFTTRDISKLSQISFAERLVKLPITRDIYAKYHYKSCYYLYYRRPVFAAYRKIMNKWYVNSKKK